MRNGSRGDPERAADILEAIAKVERWRNLDHRDDDMFRSAVMRELAVIGEAVRALSDGFKLERPTIPWRSIVDLRNVLSHHYWDAAWPLIEQILDDDLDPLRRAIVERGLPQASTRPAEQASGEESGRGGACDRWMPRARAHCVLRAGHRGGCRSR